MFFGIKNDEHDLRQQGMTDDEIADAIEDGGDPQPGAPEPDSDEEIEDDEDGQ